MQRKFAQGSEGERMICGTVMRRHWDHQECHSCASPGTWKNVHDANNMDRLAEFTTCTEQTISM